MRIGANPQRSLSTGKSRPGRTGSCASLAGRSRVTSQQQATVNQVQTHAAPSVKRRVRKCMARSRRTREPRFGPLGVNLQPRKRRPLGEWQGRFLRRHIPDNGVFLARTIVIVGWHGFLPGRARSCAHRAANELLLPRFSRLKGRQSTAAQGCGEHQSQDRNQPARSHSSYCYVQIRLFSSQEPVMRQFW